MGKLYSSDCFDSFLLESAVVKTGVTWTLDAHLNKSFYPEHEWNDPAVRPYELAEWKAIRPLCRELVKGTRAPVSFRFDFCLKPEFVPKTLGEQNQTLPVSSLRLSVRYDGSRAAVITGVAYSGFTLDRDGEKLWDRAAARFLEHHGIEYDIA